MAAQRQSWESQNPLMQRMTKNSGTISYNVSPLKDEGDEDISKSALTVFRAKEEEIERKKIEVREKVQAQLGRVEEEKYKEAIEAFNEKNREKAQLITKLVELVSESEKLRMKKLEELNKNIDSLH
ncbi:RAB6-interacting golgin [Dillenia turbinata]|uniref:RAB6-interacting golgin n=1 Tax=Dillenia turbinata TaxID=194707 RepID=A0AAN8VXU6_9MAGN